MSLEPFLHLQWLYRYDEVTKYKFTSDKVRVGISLCMSKIQCQCLDVSVIAFHEKILLPFVILDYISQHMSGLGYCGGPIFSGGYLLCYI